MKSNDQTQVLHSIITNALNIAKETAPYTDGKAVLHRKRSMNFVEALGKLLRESYSENNGSVRVLTKHYSENKGEFGLNELLFDVLVCEVATTKAAKAKKPLTYVRRGIWAVESELAKNSREAVYDFNKLCLSSCENQLFIGPLTSDNQAFLDPLRTVARSCSGSIYVALIPHPSEWASKDFSIDSIIVEKLKK